MVSAAMPLAETGECLSRLFEEHHRRILLAAYRITGNMADAEDVTQAVFLRLARDGTNTMQNTASYLYRAAINGALDLLRRRRTAATEPLDAVADFPSAATDAQPDMAVSNRELGKCLRLAIGELSPRTAEMFTLRYFEDLDNRQIAKSMSTSQAVVAVTLHHARSQLKKRLGEMQRGKR